MDDEELEKALFPQFRERLKYLEGGGRLVHYTNAEKCLLILKNREFWLRNAQVMNDFSEIEHGTRCLAAAVQSQHGDQLKLLLDTISINLWPELIRSFDNDNRYMRIATFIASFSEHQDRDDQYGKLSMWRAYGGSNGVAMVFNPTIFKSRTDELGVVLAPVEYKDPDDFVAWFAGWVEGISEHIDQLATLPSEEIRNAFFTVFRVFALCTKHPGFKEEREWRAFHSPVYEDETSWLSREIVCLDGLPQTVIKISLADDEEKGVTGLSPNGLINRLIIGPSDQPSITREALVSTLGNADVLNPNNRVFTSTIPLRH